MGLSVSALPDLNGLRFKTVHILGSIITTLSLSSELRNVLSRLGSILGSIRPTFGGLASTGLTLATPSLNAQ